MSWMLRLIFLRPNWSISFFSVMILMDSFIMWNYSESWDWVKWLGIVGSWTWYSII
jgi:hypothetical protein